MAWTEFMPVWVALRFIAGLASAGAFVLAGTLVMQSLQSVGQQTRMGVHFTGVGLGIAFSGLLLAQAGEYLGWRGGWTALALSSIALLPLCWTIPRPGSRNTQHAAVQTDATESLAPLAFPMRLLVIAYFLEGLGYIVSGTFLVAIVKTTPGLGAFAEYAWVAVGLAAAPSAMLWSAVQKKTGPLKALIAAHLVQAAGIMLPVFSESLGVVLVAAIAFGGTFVGITVLAINLATRIAPANSGRVIGQLTVAFGLGQILGPLSAGIIAGEGRGFDLPLLAAGATVTLGALLLLAGAVWRK